MKKFLAIILAVGSIFCFTACDNDMVDDLGDMVGEAIEEGAEVAEDDLEELLEAFQ